MNIENNFTSFKDKHPSSLFLSLEGIEGSGKSTQIKFIQNYYEKKKYRVINLREPGGTELGEKIRNVILTSDSKITEISELLLFAASRAHLLTQIILKELKKEKTIVILDRYFDSSLAYQGIARGLGIQTVIDIHKFSPLNIMPDKTFYLEIDLLTSHERQKARGQEKDYFEKENNQFYSQLIEGYETAFRLFPKRIVKVDAKKSQGEVSQIIQNILDCELV